MKTKQLRAKIDCILGYENGMELQGTTNNGQDVIMFLDQTTFKAISDIFQVTNHLGHAVWHYTNKVPIPCELCKQNKGV